MPTFVAQVKNNSGKVFKEKIQALTPEQARVLLKMKYASVGKINKAGMEIDLSRIESALANVSIKDKVVFSRQFSVMINAGVAIVRCLGVLSEQCGNPKLKKALIAISAEVQQGSPLSEAMAKHPECFDQLYVSMVEAGEAGGVLDEVLSRLAKLLEDMARLKNQIKSAMAYPVTVGVLAIIVFFAMTIFLIPVFAKIFQDLDVPLTRTDKIHVVLEQYYPKLENLNSDWCHHWY